MYMCMCSRLYRYVHVYMYCTCRLPSFTPPSSPSLSLPLSLSFCFSLPALQGDTDFTSSGEYTSGSHLEIPGLSDPNSINVEESLSPRSLSVLKEKKSLLAEKLQSHSLRGLAGLPSVPLVDYTELDLPR